MTVRPASGWLPRCLSACAALSVSLLVPAWQADVHAQTVPTVEVNKAFKVVAAHDGTGTTHYVLTVDRPGTAADVVVTLPVASLANAEVAFDVAAQTVVGAYSAKVCARNVDPADPTNFGETCAPVLAFNVAKPVMPPPPTAPKLRIVGTITLAGLGPMPVVIDVDEIQTLYVGGVR